MDDTELVSVIVGSIKVVEGSTVLVGSWVSVEVSILAGSDVLRGGSVTVDVADVSVCDEVSVEVVLLITGGVPLLLRISLELQKDVGLLEGLKPLDVADLLS